jgi:AraC-like DNA-binding protein
VNAKLSGEDRKASLYFELLVFELAELRCKGNKSHFLQNIINVIHSYPEKFFTNSELAEMSNVSVKTAETKFKAEFGKTIHQYILDFKMEEAKSYFEKFVGISVKEVAYNLGFCDEYHFSKQFSKYVGVSPVAYKKELKNKAENKCKE